MITTSSEDLTEMVSGYLSCAIWTATDEDGESLSQHVGNGPKLEARGRGGEFVISGDEVASLLDLGTIVEAVQECIGFCDGLDDDLSELDVGQAGHDFWLTRNGHGAGFWDRGLGDVGERLSDAAKAWGSANIHVEHDGRWYMA